MKPSFNLNRLISSIGLEDVTGETVDRVEKEVEHVWFGMIPLDQLEALAKMPYVSKHLQEQFQCTIEFDRENPEVRTVLRVRRVNRSESVLTRKTRTDSMVGQLEQSIEIDDKTFDFLSHVFGTGIMKMRYDIQPDAYPRKLQLDVFYDKTGNIAGDGKHAFAKYDYEVASADEPVPELPIALINQMYLNPFTAGDNLEVVHALRKFMAAQGFRL